MRDRDFHRSPNIAAGPENARMRQILPVFEDPVLGYEDFGAHKGDHSQPLSTWDQHQIQSIIYAEGS